jgi:RimJ/RimL family protein N-acetyltransferase
MVSDDKHRVAAFLASILPFHRSRGWGEFAAIGYLLDGNLIAGTIYNNYDPDAEIIEMSSASIDPRWLTRKSIHAMFDYPFNQLHCQMVVLRVAESNARMRSIARRFGFDEYIIPRLRGRHEAECIQTLTTEQWQGERRE